MQQVGVKHLMYSILAAMIVVNDSVVKKVVLIFLNNPNEWNNEKYFTNLLNFKLNAFHWLKGKTYLLKIKVQHFTHIRWYAS